MNNLQKMLLASSFVLVLAACQSNEAMKEVLSNSDTRIELMDSIANDSSLSQEMFAAMMNGKNGKTVLTQHQGDVLKMMKDDPSHINGVMSNMMDLCEHDTTLMAGMCSNMMDNPRLMNRLNKMKDERGRNSVMDMCKMKRTLYKRQQ